MQIRRSGAWVTALLCIILSLTSCQASGTRAGEAVSGQSAQGEAAEAASPADPAAMRQSLSEPGSFVETDFGCYYLSDYFIYYADRGSTNYVKLCGRPDCTHDSEDCNAYIGSDTFSYYEDEIYYCQYETSEDKPRYELWKMQADGSQHEKVKTIYTASSSTLSLQGFFHQGYYYFTDAPLGLSQQGTGLYRVKLDSHSETEQLLPASDLSHFYTMWACQDQLYFTGINDQEQIYLSSFDLESGVLQQRSDNWSLYGQYFSDSQAFCYIPDDGFYQLDLTEAGRQRKVAASPASGELGAYYDSEYIYLFDVEPLKTGGGSRKLYVLDRNYQELAETEIKSEDFSTQDLYFLTAAAGRLLFVDRKSFTGPVIPYYIDQKDIRSGTLQLRKTAVSSVSP
ncbi:MAG: hypothetical protein PHR21_00355 [Oscillospiraceae bacterium]|mgnify:CR=1 FL=1|nr:hypothetical protein [Oscillospiraceae bacterium]MDD4368968.1 hypothetical protein [Oscillospiraceae bacterium]